MGIGKNGYYRLDDILKYKCVWNIIYGDRAKGKSFAPKERALEYAWRTQQPTLAYIRRNRDDIAPELICKYFEERGVNLIEKVTNKEYNMVDYYKGYIHWARLEDGKIKRVYSSKYALSSIVYCGKCGDLFRRVAWKARGASYNKWRCASRIEKGPKKGCDADAISEVELQNAVVRAINKTLGGREQLQVQLQHNIEDVLNGDSTATLEYIDQRMAELQEKLVMCVNKNAEYDVIANEIDALREKKAAVVTRDAEQEMLRKRIDEMRQFLQTQTNRVTEYDEQMVRRLIEKITVFDDKLIFEFKSGMTLELKR